jgi:glycosyltransferase involved in cell wall biosynthesis
VNINKLQKKEGDDEAIEKLKNKYDGKKIVFTSGRHVPYKGLKFLVDAVPLLSDDSVVVIAGKGPLSATLKERNASPALHFPGRISDDELRHYLYASDVFAFPSITRNEAFGVALAEAMYCGLPAVTFTIPGSGVNWVCVDGETGIEAENGNVQALSAAINKLFTDDDLRESLGNNASIRVREKFTLSAIKEKLDNLYA